MTGSEITAMKIVKYRLNRPPRNGDWVKADGRYYGVSNVKEIETNSGRSVIAALLDGTCTICDGNLTLQIIGSTFWPTQRCGDCRQQGVA